MIPLITINSLKTLRNGGTEKFILIEINRIPLIIGSVSNIPWINRITRVFQISKILPAIRNRSDDVKPCLSIINNLPLILIVNAASIDQYIIVIWLTEE